MNHTVHTDFFLIAEINERNIKMLIKYFKKVLTKYIGGGRIYNDKTERMHMYDKKDFFIDFVRCNCCIGICGSVGYRRHRLQGRGNYSRR